jgi:hypothetical protein
LAEWFDNGMDRLSGAFKRWTQVLTFVIALLVDCRQSRLHSNRHDALGAASSRGEAEMACP